MTTQAAQTNGTLVEVASVGKVFHRGSEEIRILQDLHLKVPTGQFLALMGPSGSGKSTLLNLIGGLDRPTRGTVSIAGERIDQLSDRKLASWRARHSRRRSPSCAETVCAKNPISNAISGPNCAKRRPMNIPQLIVALRMIRIRFGSHRHPCWNKLRQRIHVRHDIVIFQHAEIFDSVEILVTRGHNSRGRGSRHLGMICRQLHHPHR